MTPALIAAAGWHVLTHEVLGFAAAGMALSTIDDLVVDLAYAALFITRRTRLRPLVGRSGNPGWMAITIPAWDEAAVIGAMLTALTRDLDYPHFIAFVGVYPNDPATRIAVEHVGDPRIVVVKCTRPGPTTKADCLNHLWRAVERHEAAAGMTFKAVVLHDAEDVVDPAELQVFDAHIPSLAMVQLPVIPLADRGSRWVSGHYLDEFAEAHRKDIVVRGAIGAGVPSAGVACAVDRAVLGRLAAPGGSPFDAGSMTEDYELGMRIAAIGGRAALLRVRGSAGAIATREYFPSTFAAAVRQKTRWLLGIALDGWDRIGWRETLADRYMLLRDRKTIITPLLVATGYAAVMMCGVDAVARTFIPSARNFAPIVRDGSTLAVLLSVNIIMLGWRLGLRAGFTGAT